MLGGDVGLGGVGGDADRADAELVGPAQLADGADAWQEQTAQLIRVRRGVALVEEALRGKVFIARL